MASVDSSLSVAMPRGWDAYRLMFAASAGLYVLFGLSLSNAPFRDLPNHLARGHIIADLLFNQGSLFGDRFSLDLEFTPYLVADLMLAGLDRLVGIEWTSRIWIATAVAALPWSVWFLLGVQGCSYRARLTGSLLAFYLATNWFFVSGFLNYQISLACDLFAYGWFLRAQASGSARAYLFYVLILTAGYAMHLSSLVFLAAAVGASLALGVLSGRQSIGRALVLWLPALILLALHFGLAKPHSSMLFATDWGTPLSKMKRLLSPVVRFDARWEIPLFGAFLLAALGPLFAGGLRQALRCNKESLLLAALFAVLYFLLPLQQGGVYDVDNRALPVSLLFLLAAGMRAFDSDAASADWPVALAVTVAWLNLLYVAMEVLPQNREMGAYKSIAREIPPSGRVLPVDTRPAMGRYEAFPHAGAFVTAESGALTPYLFAAPLNPNIGYFHYRQRRHMPSLFWYTRSDDVVNWETVRQTYDYLLVTQPYDSRIPLPVDVVRGNDVATLLKIRK
jgi:hypothetical protein